MARLEGGFPWFPWDITEKNLPQEVGRDSSAISFSKGCYLGQETVARLDALGHVNRRLCGVRCDGTQMPNGGESLLADEKPVGQITSAAFSPRLNAPLAFAYLRIPHDSAGSRLTWSGGTAEVVALPLASEV
jgi:folate-binding protein YgfZ